MGGADTDMAVRSAAELPERKLFRFTEEEERRSGDPAKSRKKQSYPSSQNSCL